MKTKDFNLVAVGGFLIVILFVIVRYPDMGGMDSTAGAILFELLPGLILVSVTIFTAANSRGAARSGAVVFIGVGLAYLTGQANTAGLVTTEMLTGLTLAQVQIWMVVLGSIFGAIAYVSA